MARILMASSAMSDKRPEDLSERSFQFTCDIFDYCEELERLGGIPRRLAYQLFDAAGSVGANRAESKSSYSRREFKSKNAISLKEMREALFWLRVAEVKRLGDRDLRHRLLKEANELVSIFVTVIRNLGDP